MQTTLDYRRENLRKLIEQWNGPLPLSKKLGYSNASFLVQMAGPHPSREVSEKTARAIEIKLQLPTLWLDQPPPKKNASPKRINAENGATTKEAGPLQMKQNVTKVGDATVDVGIVSEVIRVVGQTSEDMGVALAPAKLASVVMMVYDDVLKGGELRTAYVQQLVQLLK